MCNLKTVLLHRTFHRQGELASNNRAINYRRKEMPQGRRPTGRNPFRSVLRIVNVNLTGYRLPGVWSALSLALPGLVELHLLLCPHRSSLSGSWLFSVYLLFTPGCQHFYSVVVFLAFLISPELASRHTKLPVWLVWSFSGDTIFSDSAQGIDSCRF